MEKVSIIVPAYQNEKTLGKALDSILGQTYSELEVIVINDGSKDKTRRGARTVSKKGQANHWNYTGQ